MSNESYIRLKGKRCIGLVRCSTVGQADTSIPDQIAALRNFAAEHGLIIVDIVILPGLSGSIPGNRDDLSSSSSASASEMISRCCWSSIRRG